MFIILTYDVKQKRVSKAMKVCRKYLTHVQKSVFEGNITGSKLEKLKRELKSVLDLDEDAVCIYSMDNLAYMYKEQIGVASDNSNII